MCSCVVHRTQRTESFQAICGRQIVVAQSKNETLETILHVVGNVPTIHMEIDEEKKRFMVTKRDLRVA